MIIPYYVENKKFLGYLAAEVKERPSVLIAPAWMGQNEFARNAAKKFTRAGYNGFAMDLYGEGQVANDREEAMSLMQELVADPMLIRERITAAISCMQERGHTKIALVGYCFGGACVIEAVRANLAIKGAVSVHGILGNPYKLPTKESAWAEAISPSLLVLHGQDDPFVTKEDIETFQKKMTAKGVDWQMICYSHTVHAFTNPEVNMPEVGLVYNERSANRSWSHTLTFLKEIFFNE